MSVPTDSNRLTHLEASIAHMEHLCDQLNKIVIEQDRQLTRLQKRLDQLADGIEGAEQDRLRQSQERPPHYGR